jgi:general secretion pathway protein I
MKNLHSIYNLPSKKKKAFSLLEVILALAILTGAIAVLGELGHFGFRNAKASQDLTRAELLCESKMAEYTSGITIPQSIQGVPFDTIDQDGTIPWVYSVDMEQVANQEGLIALRVTVSQDIPGSQRPITFSLTHWIVDPSLTSTSSTDSESTSSPSGTGGQ